VVHARLVFYILLQLFFDVNPNNLRLAKIIGKLIKLMKVGLLLFVFGLFRRCEVIPISNIVGHGFIGNLKAQELRHFIFKGEVEKTHWPVGITIKTLQCYLFVGYRSAGDSSDLFLCCTLPWVGARIKVRKRIGLRLTQNTR
jgi:hypothetical protein